MVLLVMRQPGLGPASCPGFMAGCRPDRTRVIRACSSSAGRAMCGRSCSLRVGTPSASAMQHTPWSLLSTATQRGGSIRSEADGGAVAASWAAVAAAHSATQVSVLGLSSPPRAAAALCSAVLCSARNPSRCRNPSSSSSSAARAPRATSPRRTSSPFRPSSSRNTRRGMSTDTTRPLPQPTTAAPPASAACPAPTTTRPDKPPRLAREVGRLVGRVF
ncbi:hypothetical protein V8C86DRAFT_2753051, partial [Haematococcus lacustris]